MQMTYPSNERLHNITLLRMSYVAQKAQDSESNTCQWNATEIYYHWPLPRYKWV